MNSAHRILLEKKKLNGESLFFGLTRGEQAIAAVMDEIIAQNLSAQLTPYQVERVKALLENGEG